MSLFGYHLAPKWSLLCYTISVHNRVACCTNPYLRASNPNYGPSIVFTGPEYVGPPSFGPFGYQLPQVLAHLDTVWPPKRSIIMLRNSIAQSSTLLHQPIFAGLKPKYGPPMVFIDTKYVSFTFDSLGYRLHPANALVLTINFWSIQNKPL